MSVSSNTYPTVPQSNSPPLISSEKIWWTRPKRAGATSEGSRCACKTDCTSLILWENKVRRGLQWNGPTRSYKLTSIALGDHGMIHSSSFGNADRFGVTHITIWDRPFWEAQSQMRIDTMSDLKLRNLTIKTLKPSVPWNSNAACFLCLDRLGSIGDEVVRASWSRKGRGPSFYLHSKCIPASKETPYVTDPGAERFWLSLQVPDGLHHSVTQIPQHLHEGQPLGVLQASGPSSAGLMPLPFVQNQQTSYYGPSYETSELRQGFAPSGSQQSQGPPFGYQIGYQPSPQEFDLRGNLPAASWAHRNMSYQLGAPSASSNAPASLEYSDPSGHDGHTSPGYLKRPTTGPECTHSRVRSKCRFG